LSSELGEIVDRCIRVHGSAKTCEVLDMMKSMGFKYSTRGAITISIYDMTIPPEKQPLIAESEAKVDKINEYYRKGLLSEDERSKRVVDEWSACTNRVTDALKRNLDKYNPLNLMSTSGARGSIKQIRQLAGMRGLMFAATGKTIEMPIKANFREGMKVLEYFIAARGARKGLADTALRTADSGYLTRRLVDVSQEVIIREHDCGDTRGLVVRKIVDVTDGGKEAVIEPFINRLVGRYTIGDVVHPETGEVIVSDNCLIKESDAQAIVSAGIEEVRIRSVINCKAQRGICVHCYGADLATGLPVSIGESVGIIAAQSIGEPGTQLTMRTFHTGGVAGSDITQGLPRVEEIFEARRPKKAAELAEIDGIVRIEEGKRSKQITIVNDEEGIAKTIPIPGAAKLLVKEGDRVIKCQKLTEGTETPADILRISGLDAVYAYIIKEIQRVYGLQGVEINDKHIEVIARQMTKKVRVESAGDTKLLVGSSIDCAEVLAANDKIKKKNESGETEIPLLEATYSPLLLGITKASLSTDSFLSAASFQETTKVLTEAAIKGKRDPLVGLKENVIIGKLIPAGTGLKHYNRVEIVNNEEEQIGAYDLRYGQPS
ncbi:MAG: DNA-directed RNA polymerase subunit beta', partial [Clostridia bacterium]|nr:DNA-directed RNA polymerase subunit beta' [Clostridia bacterium]